VIGAAKARATLMIEPILNGQWETAEKLKSRSGYATIGDIIEHYLSQAEDRPACLASSDSSHEERCYGFSNYSRDHAERLLLQSDFVTSAEPSTHSACRIAFAVSPHHFAPLFNRKRVIWLRQFHAEV